MTARQWLAGGLIATLAASAWLATRGDDTLSDAVAPRGASRAGAAPRLAVADRPAAGAWPVVDAATPRAEWPAPADDSSGVWSPSVPAAPAPPVRAAAPADAASALPAPAFPFTFIGRWEEGGREQVLLSSPIRVWVVGIGTVLEGQWRLDRIEAASITVTFLPRGATRTVALAPST